MEGKKKRFKLVLIIAIILMFISMIGASQVQTDFGNVTMKELKYESTMGYSIAGDLFVPDGVSAENPAPTIVVCHGVLDNKELHDATFVELARRGYVVFAMDIPAHGDSERTDDFGVAFQGLYESVKMVSTIDYVDSSRIGIVGHSMGGMSANTAVMMDNEMPEHLIKAVLLNSADAEYYAYDENGAIVDGEFVDYYGNRDVGIIAGLYDEFFFADVDADGNATPPRDFVKNKNAQSFLYAGTDPAGKALREAGVMYTKQIDGDEAFRVIYSLPQTHMWSLVSNGSITSIVNFFQASIGAPNPIDASNQIWPLKQAFNLVGLIGFMMFFVSFAILMTFTPAFASVRGEESGKPLPFTRKDWGWFWGGWAIITLLAVLLYFPVTDHYYATLGMDRLNPVSVSVWAAICAVIEIAYMVIFYFVTGRKNGLNLSERGVKIPLKKIGKTVLLSLIVLAVSYGWVFFAKYFFNTDFRIWVFDVVTFSSEKIFTALYSGIPGFVLYFIVNSVVLNSFDYNTIGKKPWVNTALIAVLNVLPVIVLIIWQYSGFATTGFLTYTKGCNATMFLPMILLFLPLAAIVSRTIYKATNNPYISGIFMGVLAAMMDISATMIY